MTFQKGNQFGIKFNNTCQMCGIMECNLDCKLSNYRRQYGN